MMMTECFSLFFQGLGFSLQALVTQILVTIISSCSKSLLQSSSCTSSSFLGFHNHLWMTCSFAEQNFLSAAATTQKGNTTQQTLPSLKQKREEKQQWHQQETNNPSSLHFTTLCLTTSLVHCSWADWFFFHRKSFFLWELHGHEDWHWNCTWFFSSSSVSLSVSSCGIELFMKILSLESHMILLSHGSSGFFFLSVSFPVEFGTHPEESMSFEILNIKEERYKKMRGVGCVSPLLFLEGNS